jgi:UDP-GlcNAc3NAcA epimerase
MIDPVGYIDMVALTSGSRYVVTDSGGLQKEAYFFRKYCITLREETEWTELVEAGVNTLCGASYGRIIEAVKRVSEDSSAFTKLLYGNGTTASQIVKSLEN